MSKLRELLKELGRAAEADSDDFFEIKDLIKDDLYRAADEIADLMDAVNRKEAPMVEIIAGVVQAAEALDKKLGGVE